MTDQLDRVLDDWLTGFDAPVPSMPTLRQRVRVRRRRRVALVTAASVVLAGLIGGGLALRPAPRPALLEMSNGEVRLTDHVTLQYVPEWVDHVNPLQVDVTPAQRVFGYREQIFELADAADSRTVRIYIDRGDPFDPRVASRLRRGTTGTIDGDVVLFDPPDAMVNGSPLPGVVVRITGGDDLEEVRRIYEGLALTPDDEPLPGDAVVITSGVSSGVPWDVRVTRPDIGDTTAADPDRHCVVVKTYTSGIACMRLPTQGASVQDFASFEEGVDPQRTAVRTGDEVATVVVHRRARGTERAATVSLTPAAGRVAVVASSSENPVAIVDLLDADGNVIDSVDVDEMYGP
jgi:hypothetical protein